MCREDTGARLSVPIADITVRALHTMALLWIRADQDNIVLVSAKQRERDKTTGLHLSRIDDCEPAPREPR